MTIQNSHYCVPTALSILTSLPIEEVEKQLKEKYLGDVEISGIYIGLALKFLSDNGFHWTIYNAEGDPLSRHHTYAWEWEPKNSVGHLVEIKGHVLILKNKKVYDNSHPDGVPILEYKRRAERIVRAYRITKDA